MAIRKRSRAIKLVLLGTASLLVGGCGGCDEKHNAGGGDLPNIDPVLAKKAVAAGTSVEISDAFLQGLSVIATGPVSGLTAPIELARVGYSIDHADETVDVITRESGLQPVNRPEQQVRHVYHYHSSPGIGWFLWGHMLGSSTARAGTPYTAPRSYGSTPRSYTAGSGYSAGRSASPASGGVSRGGFGSSGSAHASGGTS
ncbi:MAG TPA: hypothetical protein PLN21_18665 [Gemmatales bacterium]|nr:hypothetical protein [Gemmatales bacterium]